MNLGVPWLKRGNNRWVALNRDVKVRLLLKLNSYRKILMKKMKKIKLIKLTRDCFNRSEIKMINFKINELKIFK